MDQKTAQLALAFLNRVQLQGNEVGTFIHVQNALTRLAQEPAKGQEKPQDGDKTILAGNKGAAA